MEINLPYNFNPRPYQSEALEWLLKFQRAVLIWHRRAWKDKTAFQAFIRKALERKWVYYYIFPEYEQWRKAMWNNIDNDGLHMLSHIPKELVKNKNDQSMIVELINGSMIQVIWTDRKIDNIVGTNPVGVLFSEYPISDPRWWDLLRPILKLNGWFAWFVFTPRGKNHWWKLREVARKNPEQWYLSEKTAFDTYDNNGNRIVTDQMIEEERRDWMDEDLIQQEYFVSFEASVKWAYYADQIRDARKEWRISRIPYEETLPVHTFWDLGMNDTTAIWFVQFLWKEVRCIDHYEMSGEWLEHYVRLLQSKPYNYWTHYLPHDVRVREMWIAQTREEFLYSLGMKNIVVLPPNSPEEWIDAARRMFKNVWIDDTNCERWLNALASYHKEYDDKNQTFRARPKHDWSSNSADAFRYLAVAYNSLTKTRPDNIAYEADYSWFY